MPSTPLFGLAAVVVASALAAGCASQNAAPSASAPATSSGTAPAPVAPPAPVREGLAASDVAQIVAGDARNVRGELVGKTVSLDLTRAQGRGVPAGSFTAGGDADGPFYRCRTSARGFTGGEVTARVAAYQFIARGKQHLIDLDRCAPPTPQSAQVSAAPAAPAPVAAPAAAGAAAVGAGKPGMDGQGRVVDSSKVEAGSGRTVKGLNDYEGEITGIPAAGSKFTKLQIGMPTRQVIDLIGAPTDQGAYITGKAWIPFYFGGDRHRFEMTYKGQGRLIFAGGGLGDFTSGNLIWIIHNDKEPGYR